MAKFEVLLVLGRVHSRLGGAGRTVEGYAAGLERIGHRVTVLGISDDQTLPGLNLGPEVGTIAISGTGGAVELARQISSGRYGLVVSVGVWHLPFFVSAAASLLLRTFVRTSARFALIPTMSLTRFDIGKRAVAKSALMPLVRVLLRKFRAIAFSSSGELEDSRVRVPRRRSVILEPTLLADLIDDAGDHEGDILFVGRIDEQKDLRLLLDAVALMPSRSLSIVGDGNAEYTRSLKARSVELGIADRVHWAGWLDTASTRRMMGASKVLLVTSQEENFCHVAVEAVLCGAEVVLVDRILSAPDLTRFASIAAVEPTATELAVAAERAMADWRTRGEVRASAARELREACSPAAAARSLMRLVVDTG